MIEVKTSILSTRSRSLALLLVYCNSFNVLWRFLYQEDRCPPKASAKLHRLSDIRKFFCSQYFLCFTTHQTQKPANQLFTPIYLILSLTFFNIIIFFLASLLLNIEAYYNYSRQSNIKKMLTN